MSLFPPLPKQIDYLLIIGALRRCGLRMLVHAVDYAPDGAVDYAPDGAVDYAPAVLWITWLRHCGLWASPCGLRERCSL